MLCSSKIDFSVQNQNLVWYSMNSSKRVNGFILHHICKLFLQNAWTFVMWLTWFEIARFTWDSYFCGILGNKSRNKFPFLFRLEINATKCRSMTLTETRYSLFLVVERRHKRIMKKYLSVSFLFNVEHQ